MAEDKEILKEIWDGKLPLCFRLAESEWRSSEPEEIYIMAPRQTYFPLITEKVQKYLSEFISPSLKTNEIWLDYKGTPLKWHYPIGLLFDLYVSDGSENSANLPWCLNVHFDSFPEDLLHCGGKDIIESYFLSRVKEADALKHKGKVINEMQTKDHKQLWQGVQSDKYDQFWSINKKLMDGEFKAIPFRIYQVDKPFIQKLIEPVNESGQTKTLEDLLNSVLGENFKKSNLVLIQGVVPSLKTPIQWLSEHLSYPDNFLHICVK